MAVLTVFVGGADQGAVALFGRVGGDVAKGAFGTAGVWAGTVAGAGLYALGAIRLALAAG